MGESERFTTFDGTGLAYRRWPGGRGPVVLHHGFASDAVGNWIRPGIVDRLVDAGFEVMAVDARGHGASDKPHDPARYGEATMARDVSALADHLGYGQWIQVGYSMGAIVSLLVAIDEPRVQRLLLGGIGGSVAEGGRSRGAVADALLADDASTLTNRSAAAFRAFADANGADRKALAAQARAAYVDAPPLDRITVPTLVLVGEDDRLATRPEVLADGIRGARLALVPGDHLGAVSQPAFVDGLVAFVEENG